MALLLHLEILVNWITRILLTNMPAEQVALAAAKAGTIQSPNFADAAMPAFQFGNECAQAARLNPGLGHRGWCSAT
ncbi:MAG: hypothetical protein M3O62_01715 [Pseudomonadota bacterium]|nr:hypothetical protein [Pseudomonadota bacterium]